LKEETIISDKILDYNQYRESSIPIIIESGAFQCRAGFGSHPTPQFIFRNLISKQRGKKDSEILVGNDIHNLEAVKWLLRSPFESDVVTQFDVHETIFDYIFSHLGIDTNSVEHPIVLNEALYVPIWSRSHIQELLFECYEIPSLLLGVDSLLSLYHNLPDIQNCLVIRLGHYTCHVLAIVDGKLCSEASTRINLGGLNLTLYLQRLLQLKYPKHTQEFTFTKCENIVQNLCKFSSDYDIESSKWSDQEYYDKNVKQFKTSNYNSTQQTQLSFNENFTIRSQRLLSKVESNLSKKREKQVFFLIKIHYYL
jgi:actin-related protein 5